MHARYKPIIIIDNCFEWKGNLVLNIFDNRHLLKPTFKWSSIEVVHNFTCFDVWIIMIICLINYERRRSCSLQVNLQPKLLKNYCVWNVYIPYIRLGGKITVDQNHCAVPVENFTKEAACRLRFSGKLMVAIFFIKMLRPKGGGPPGPPLNLPML